MAIKTPIKATFTGSDVTGLAEFQSGDSIGVAYGGTGANTLTGLVVGNGVSAFTAVTDGTNGQVLTTNGAGTYSFQSVAAGASSVASLTDVTLTSLADGEILKYDSGSGQWVNAADAGGIALTDLSASDGITYNNTTGAFSLTDTGVTANTYGSSSQVPVITVNANGQITSAATAAVAGVSSTSFNTSTGVLTINTSDGSSYTNDLGIGTADSPQFTGLTVTNTITGTVSSLSNHDTDDLSEGVTNLYYTNARFDTQLATKTTDNLSEGATNLYYTDARVDARVNLQTGANLDLSSKSTTDLSEGTNLYYTNARADARVNLQTGANLDLSSKTTDDLTQGSINLYYDDSLVDSHLSGGTGVTYSSGIISIGQDVGTSSNVEFNSIIIQGNLTVNGTTTTVNATELAIADNMIYLNDGSTTTNPDLGWAGNYNDGTYAHAGIFRDATDGIFKFYDGYTPEPGQAIDISHASFNLADVQAGSFTGNLTGNVTGTVSSLSNHNTTDLAEGTNLYYTDARADARVNLQTGSNLDLSNKTSDDLTEGSTNLYYTNARFDTRLASKTTTNLTEGTNLYYTDARADARVNLQTGSNLDLSSKTTTDLVEGTNLYYTDARVDTHLNTSSASTNDVLTWNGSDYVWSAASSSSSAQNELVSLNTTYTVTLEDSGDFTLQNSGAIANKEAVLTTTTANQTVDTFPFATYRTAKYIFQATAGNDVHATELLITHDETTVYTTEYATIFSGSSLMTLSASISGSNVVVTATPANANTTIDFVRVSLIGSAPTSGGTSSLEGDLQTDTGIIDLQSDTGTEDLNGAVTTTLQGDLSTQIGTEDLATGSGTEELNT